MKRGLRTELIDDVFNSEPRNVDCDLDQSSLT
jgi:hypothetical protein